MLLANEVKNKREKSENESYKSLNLCQLVKFSTYGIQEDQDYDLSIVRYHPHAKGDKPTVKHIKE